jgi:uncharacterized protein (DUF1330 family)
MAGYVIAQMSVTDPEAFADYPGQAGPTVAAFGGRYVVRGGTIDNIEGDWKPGRVVIIEFDSVAQAKAWYDSQMYEEAKALRIRSTISSLMIVEGA